MAIPISRQVAGSRRAGPPRSTIVNGLRQSEGWQPAVLFFRGLNVKLAIAIGGQTLDAEFSASDGTARLSFDQQNYAAQIATPEPGLFTIILNQRVYNCVLDELPNGQTEVVVNGQHFPIAVHDKKHLRGQTGAATAGGKATLMAPMPGKVVRVLCAVGEEVAAEQGLLVVEAMKMQNEVQSPKTGKVTELRVSEGQTVNAGEVLVIVE
ncbi:MAG: biotin attachment protein [Acidobacteria bacterium]|nr:biotin attachment protein [Acidobacteriota bacterium]